MVRNEDILNDILLKMKYDPSKTLSEQLGGSSLGDLSSLPKSSNSSYKKPEDELIAWRKNYPNQCKHKDKALMPEPVGNLSQRESLIKGYCLYSAPNGGVWVPAASDVSFHDMGSLSNDIDTKIEERDKGDGFFSGMTDQDIQKVIMSLLPVGTIWSFNVGENTVTNLLGRPSTASLGRLPEVNDFYYKGLFYYPPVNGVSEPYIQPKREDTRSDWDYFVDEYGFWAQIGAAVLFAAVSIATGGAGGIMLLAAEIAVEGALGVMIAQREFEKGNDAAAWFELAFSLTPWLKTSKFLKGVSKVQVDEIVKKMKNANLPLEATPDEIMTFYRSLNDTEKEIFSKMLKDMTDEVTEAQMKEALGKAAVENLYKTVKANPDIVKNVEWWKKVVAKEGMVNGAIIISQVTYESIFGEPLSEEEKERIKGVYNIIPERLESDLAEQILYDMATSPENTKILVENSEEIGKELSTKLISKDESKRFGNIIKQRAANRNARIAKEILVDEYGMDLRFDNQTDDNNQSNQDNQPNQDNQSNLPTTASMARNQGWKPSKSAAMNSGGCEENNLDELQIGDRTYYKCKQ